MTELLKIMLLSGVALTTMLTFVFFKKNENSLEDYVLAKKLLNKEALTLSLVATFFSLTSITSNPIRAFSSGIVGPITLLLFFSVSFIIMAYIVSNMVSFPDCSTVGDIMGKLYGNVVGILVGIASFLFSFFVLSAQIHLMLHINDSLLKISPTIILAILLLVVCYTALGGIRAVVHTDVLQLIIGTLTLVGFTSFLVHQIGGLQALFKQLPVEKLTGYGEHGSLWSVLRSAFFVAGTFTFVATPPIVTRMFASKQSEARKMFFTGASISFILYLVAIFIGLAAVVYYQSDVAMQEMIKVKNLHLISHMSKVLFGENNLLLWLMFFGMAFIGISTFDSFLLSNATDLIHNVVKPLCNKIGINIHEVRWIKIATLAIGFISVLNNLFYNLGFTMVDSQPKFYYFAIILYSSIILPMIAGMLGLKTDTRSFWSFSIVYGTGVLLGNYFTPLHEYTVVLLSLVIAAIAFFASHIIINQGIAIRKTTSSTSAHTPPGFFARSYQRITSLGQLPRLANKKVETYGSEPRLFAIFYLAASLIMLIAEPSVIAATRLGLIIYGIGLSLCIGLLSRPFWTGTLKTYFDLYWFLVLFYCIPFQTTLLFLTNPNANTSAIAIAVAGLLLIVSVDWQTFLMLCLGIPLAALAHYIVAGYLIESIEFVGIWNLIVVLLLVLLAGLFFGRRKELIQEQRLLKSKLYAGSIAHETNNQLNMTAFFTHLIKQAIKDKKIKKLENTKGLYTIPEELAKDLIELGPKLSQGTQESASKIRMFISALKEDISSTTLELTSVKACIQEALTDVYFQDEEIKKGLLLNLEDDFEAKIPKAYFKHIIYNIVKNAYHHGDAKRVAIRLDKTHRTLSIHDNGLGIDANALPHIYDLFYSKGRSSNMDLAFVKLIVNSFGGTISAHAKQGEGSFTEFKITFPKK